ncbi:MAG: ATP-binding protein, partial [Melioribacteraceae bacterium]|nr:ATP-binding protein [Melioribacteraceae bacterium]
SESIVVVGKIRGFWYFVNVAYDYLAILISTIYLLYFIYNSRKIYKLQAASLLIGSFLPCIPNIIYLFRGGNDFDLTPIFFILSVTIFSNAFFRFRLFDIVPTARKIFLDYINDGIIIIDKELRVIDINQTAQKIFGMEKNIGSSIFSLLRNFPDIELFIKEGVFSKEIEFKYGEKSFDLIMSPINDKNNSIVGIILHFRDVTSRVNTQEALLKREEELSELNATKDKLFSIIAHDLKNPFMAIIGFTEILETEINELSEAEKNEILKHLREATSQTYKMLDNLLRWSQIQTGRIIFEPENVLLNNIIDEVLNNLNYQAKIKNISLITDFDSVYYLNADKTLLNIVFTNLISNSIKFTVSGGSVKISASLENEYIHIFLEDSGIGMNEQEVEKVFELNKSYTKHGTSGEKGTGLGLLVVKEFIAMHKGKLSAQSTLGVGTKFTVSLPNKLLNS